MNRLFVEKLPEFNAEARDLLHDLRSHLSLDTLTGLRVVQRYDTDEDGELTPQEWSAMLLSPKDADANRDGRITVLEFAGWMQARSRR